MLHLEDTDNPVGQVAIRVERYLTLECIQPGGLDCVTHGRPRDGIAGSGHLFDGIQRDEGRVIGRDRIGRCQIGGENAAWSSGLT